MPYRMDPVKKPTEIQRYQGIDHPSGVSLTSFWCFLDAQNSLHALWLQHLKASGQFCPDVSGIAEKRHAQRMALESRGLPEKEHTELKACAVHVGVITLTKRMGWCFV